MRKKILLSLLLAVITLLSVVSPALAATRMLGDIDLNGKVEAADARSALRYAVGLDTPSAVQQYRADFDRDGSVTPADARLILRASVGLESNVYYSDGTTDPSEKEKDGYVETSLADPFRSILYDVAHTFFFDDEATGGWGAAFNDPLFTRGSPVELIYGTAGKWCCYYTIHDVFRPALREAGYSEARIEELAPLYYPQKTIATAISNIMASETNDYKEVARKLNVPSVLIPKNVPFYIPSVLMHYYQTAPESVCTTYTFHEYYDDVVTDSLIKPSDNLRSYKPKVGDIVFMSNKTTTYYKGYCTVDHTAQIIKLYPDGSFLCTEGSIIRKGIPDDLPRVRERRYFWNSNEDTYLFVNNSVVKVLACVRPKL